MFPFQKFLHGVGSSGSQAKRGPKGDSILPGNIYKFYDQLGHLLLQGTSYLLHFVETDVQADSDLNLEITSDFNLNVDNDKNEIIANDYNCTVTGNKGENITGTENRYLTGDSNTNIETGDLNATIQTGSANITAEGGIYLEATTGVFYVRTVAAWDINFESGQDFNITAAIIRLQTTNGLKITNLKSGATQGAAGAAANELWITSGHASLPDRVIMIGI